MDDALSERMIFGTILYPFCNALWQSGTRELERVPLAFEAWSGARCILFRLKAVECTAYERSGVDFNRCNAIMLSLPNSWTSHGMRTRSAFLFPWSVGAASSRSVQQFSAPLAWRN
jgi:hypothetical protein